MKIKLVDLKEEYKNIKLKIEQALIDVFEEQNFILGSNVSVFEKRFAKFLGVKFVVGVSSGTDALELALRSLGIGYKDEVIVPAMTFYSTASAVVYVGARPVFVDVEEDTGSIDTNKIEEYIINTKRRNKKLKVKAIIPVHLYGNPANIEKILYIAQKYNLYIIEDASQSHGAEVQLKLKGKKIKVGGIGDIGCFSFYPTKNLGCYGDGGAIVTNNKKIYKKIKLLHDYGRISKYKHLTLGYNKRLDTIQAAILNVKLRYLNIWNKKRVQIAKFYNEYLKDIPYVELLNYDKYGSSVYYAYTIKVHRRDLLQKHLERNNIKTLIYYPIPLHLQPAFKFLGYKKFDFPIAEKLAKEVISLPMHPELKKEKIEYVCKIITKFYK